MRRCLHSLHREERVSDAHVRDGAGEEPPLRARQLRPRLQVPDERGLPEQVRNRTHAPAPATEEDERGQKGSEVNFVDYILS